MKPVNDKDQAKNGSASTARQRRKPATKSSGWDQQKALDLATKGVRPSDIAPVVGMSPNTVRGYLQRVAPELAALQPFKDRLGDSLALTLAKCSDLEDKLLDALNKETVISTLTPTEMERLLARVNIAKGVTYDKWRLQTGKSTSNNSHQIQVTQVHQSLTFTDAASGAVRSDESLPQSPTP